MVSEVIGKRIGKGAFSSVYKSNTDNESVLIISNCTQKEAMAFGYAKPDGRRWPDIELIEYDFKEVNGEFYSLYKMPFYEKVRAPKKELSASDYKAYMQIKSAVDSFNRLRKNNHDDHYLFIDIVNDICNKNLASQLIEVFEGLMNYIGAREIGFEISPRNIAKRKTGGVVWLDLFFNRNKLRKAK